MANCSSQDPALVGSIVSNDCSVKRSEERPSKHYQTEVGRNDYSIYSSSPCLDGWNKSAIWAQNEDDSIKAEVAEWPRWETVSNRSCEKYSLPSDACKNDSTMASKMGWNESEDGNAKKVTGEGYDVIHHDDLDGRRQSSLNIHMVDTCGLSESACWDRQSDGSGKRETDRWPIWPGAISKATWQCNSHQNSTGIQSEEWTMSQDGSTMQCKSGWNDYVDGREKKENDGDAFDRDGRNVWSQSRSNIHIVGKGSLSKSVSWDRAKYENAERENDGWPRWSGAMSKTNWQCSSHQNRKGYRIQSRGCITPEDGSSMSCKRGWNESGYRKEERENDGDAFDHDGRDRWRQWRSNIHIADKGGLSKSASWDQSKDENVKRKNDDWPRWSGATSKTTSEDDSSMAFRSGCNESENGKEKCKTADGSDAFDHDDRDGWKPTSSSIRMVDKGSLSFFASWDQAKDDNTKRENDGWARWPGAMSKTFEEFPSHRNRKTISQSRGWTTSDDADSQKETGSKNPDLVQSGDPWMQHDSVMLQKCDWNTPVSWSASKGDSLDRDQRKWDPGLDQSGSDPWKEIGLAALPPKACRRKFRSETIAHGENSIRRKSKWSEQCLSSQNRKGGWNQSWRRITSEDGDFLKEINGRITDLDQSDNRWMEHRPMILPKYDRKKSGSWTESGGDGFEADHMRWGSDLDHTGHDPWERVNPSDLPKFGNPFSEKIKLSAAPDFGDPNAPKQNINTFFSKIGGKKPFRGRNRTPYHGYEHEHYQSNDAYRKGRGVSAYYGDSPSWRSQRGSQIRLQIGDAIGKHPDRDTDEFCDEKKARCLGHDGRISFEDPWKQRDHSQDIVFWRHSRSHSNGEKRNKSFQNDSSCDRFLRERCSHHDSFDNQGCLAKDESKEICHDNRGLSDLHFESCMDSLRANDVPFHSSLQVMLHGMLQNKSSDDKWDQKNTGKVSSWNVPEVSKTIVDDSHSESHLKIDDEGIRDDTIKFLVTTPKQNLDQNVTTSPYALKSQQKTHACQQSTQNLASHTNDRTDHTTSSPIQFGLNMQASPRYPSRTKNSYPDGLIQPPASNPDDEAGNHQQQTMLNIPDSSTTQASTVYVSSSDPVFIQANEDPSFNNLCGKLSPAIIRQKASMNSEDVKTRSKKLAPVEPSDKIFNTDTQFVKPGAKQASRICDLSSKSWSACHSETVDIQVNGQSNSSKYEKEEAGANEGFKGGMEDKGIRMFKFALAELVKEMLKPVWKEGRLSKEAHKTVVKKVVDKVVGVLGTNIPKTRERIDLYLSYSKEKLHKLVQDYLEMFINT